MDQQLTFPVLKQQPNKLQERIGRLYYSHGLFCSSHPYSVIVTTLLVLVPCCYPVLRLPLLGSSSQYFTTPVVELASAGTQSDGSESYKYKTSHLFQGPSVAYVQQIIVKSAISPWKADLILTDAFRAPLAEAFQIRDIVNNHQSSYSLNRLVTLNDICLQVSEPVDKLAAKTLPHFGCLFVSPANAWGQDFHVFQQDEDIVKSVFSLTDSSVDSSSLRETLFGVPWKETGIKHFNVRSRPRVLTYALTIVFQTFDPEFLHSLFDRLRSRYPSSPYPDNTSYRPEDDFVFHVYFQDLHALAEFIPLGVAYIILFLYIYFSVRKIELVKSKWALAISAVMTVIMSLLMSVGLCLWFGLNPTLNGSEILPYLIVVIGLENMLVLTKSIVSTPVHLDVKLRVAQGLSKEGWSITKNLFTELSLLTVAFLTFVPKIQEFCLFAVVGLLTDFFLQLVFFATFLSIDIRRMEISDLHKSCHRRNPSEKSICPPMPKSIELSGFRATNPTPSLQSRSLLAKPIIRRQSSVSSHNNSANVFAPTNTPMLSELPKRMKVIYFWARTRIIQRGLMVCLVMWMCFWMYTSGIVEKISENTIGISPIAEGVVRPILQTFGGGSNISKGEEHMSHKDEKSDSQLNVEYLRKKMKTSLKHRNLYLWQTLSPHHWTTLFGYYNISLSGKYISILPPVHLSIAIDPDVAIDLRTAADVETSKKSYWQFLSSAEQTDKDIDDIITSDLPYHPSSPAEVALALALSVPTVLLFIYVMVVLYRCMCTKHYAEWRSSWKSSNASNANSCKEISVSSTASNSYLITETLPVKLKGHLQEIENVIADANVIVSCCLRGDICVWDAVTGELLTSIKRSRISKHGRSRRSTTRKNGSFSSDSTYSSSPLSDDAENFAMHFSQPSTSLEVNCSTTSPLSSNSFIKHFSFDGKMCQSNSDTLTNCKYDFAKFMTTNNVGNEDGKYNDASCFQKREFQFPQNASVEDPEDVKNFQFFSPLSFQPLWSMDFCDIAIAVGCKEGRLEVWNAFSGSLDYVYEESKSGITVLRLTRDWLVTARLNGIIDFFVMELARSDKGCYSYRNEGYNSAQHKDHESIRCLWFQSVKAHNLAISALEVDKTFAVTGAFDRLVKVFKCDSGSCVYTLHGHSAPISVLLIDKYAAASAVSGCQDGLICLWDLLTGTCMYSLNAHQDSVMTLKTTAIYLVSQGSDNRICIWEKCQGHLLHSISQEHSLHSNLELLTSDIMVTTKEDSLVLWDVNHGEALRMIMVGNGDHSCHIRLLRLSGQSIVCDYGPQMFIINFPAVANKSD